MSEDQGRTSWETVSERLSELGLKLQLHYEQAAKEQDAEEEARLKEALRSVGDSIEQAFHALGAAVKDDAVRDDAKDVGRSMLDALDATFDKLGDRFRSSIKRG